MKTTASTTLASGLAMAALLCMVPLAKAQPPNPAPKGTAPTVRSLPPPSDLNGWEVVPGTDTVRDFHICWASNIASDDLKKFLENEIHEKHKGHKELDAVYPIGWTATVSRQDRLIGGWCVDFVRGRDGRALTTPKPGEQPQTGDLPDNQFRVNMSYLTKERTWRTFVTRSKLNEESKWADDKEGKDILARDDKEKAADPQPVPAAPVHAPSVKARNPKTSILADAKHGSIEYEVDSQEAANVRDLHVCMPGGKSDLNAETINKSLDISIEGVPAGAWTSTVSQDKKTGRWCIDVYAGEKTPALSKNTKMVVYVTITRGIFKTVEKGSILYGTSSEFDKRENWDDAILFTDDTNAFGPVLVSDVAPIPSAQTGETPSDAQLVTVQATAGSTATVSVVRSDGATLSGVVVDVDGEQYTTDDKGRILFPVAAGLTALVAMLPGHVGSAVRIPVVSAPPVTAVTTVQSAPAFVATGQIFTITGTGFSGAANANTVTLGGQPLNVLASSPAQLKVSAPPSTSLGTQKLSVTTPVGSSNPRNVTLVGIRLESKNTKLRTGAKGVATLVVQGSDGPLVLRVTNLAPQTIDIAGGVVMQVKTSGGANNKATIKFVAKSPGAFQITAEVDEKHK